MSADRGVAQAADPVTTEVIRHGLVAAADQMRVNLCRTAFSYVIYELTDFAAALYDRDMRLLAQAQTLPGFLGTLGHCLEATVERAGGVESLREGDVIFSTYGYDIGSHAQDATVIVPGIFGGELVGYAVIKAHHLDIGAKDPYSTDTIDIFQEGTIFPAVRLFSEGVRNEEMYRTILANSRMPDTLAGDLNAQIGSARVGLRELHRLLERFGRDRFDLAVEKIIAHGEREIRDLVQSIPDGTYRAAGSMDSNGIESDPVPLSVVVEVEGDSITIDLTESADTQKGPVNSPLASTVSHVRNAVISLAGGKTSVNEGHFRPIEVVARPGSIYNPLPPAPIFLYGWPGLQAIDLVHRALSDALPDLVPAGSGGDICAVIAWGIDAEGRHWAFGADHSAGMGAGSSSDMFVPLMHMAVSGIKSTPAEVVESEGHVLVDRMEFVPDSGGAGKFRGGPGVETHYRTREDLMVTTIFERTKTPPWGVHGGESARPNSGLLRFPDGNEREIGKATAVPLVTGSVLEVFVGGGGGYGAPSERDPERVHADIKAGLVGAEAARRDYPHAFADVKEDEAR